MLKRKQMKIVKMFEGLSIYDFQSQYSTNESCIDLLVKLKSINVKTGIILNFVKQKGAVKKGVVLVENQNQKHHKRCFIN